jgi:mannitol/fructose-specific phosphotransferase system IIA component (Ntr-type)
LFFLLCTDSEVVHLRVLAKVNRIARRKEAMSRLVGAASPAEVLQVLVQADQEGA